MNGKLRVKYFAVIKATGNAVARSPLGYYSTDPDHRKAIRFNSVKDAESFLNDNEVDLKSVRIRRR